MAIFTPTTAGLAKFTAALNTAPVTLSEIRIGTGRRAAGDIPAATGLVTPITGGVYDIDTPQGQSKYAVVHTENTDNLLIEAIDISNDVFSVNEAGLYDSAGTLMAYLSAAASQSILVKSADGNMSLLVEVEFTTPVGVGAITYTAGAVRAATTDRAGIVELATQAEVDAGTDNTRAVTPATTPRAIDVQEFTASGTWTKPDDAQLLIVEMIGGGGGAAGFNNTTAQTIDYSTGGGGAASQFIFDANEFGNTEPVVIGAGGTAAYDQTRPGRNPDQLRAGPGGYSQFGSVEWYRAHGGVGGIEDLASSDADSVPGAGARGLSGSMVLGEGGGAGIHGNGVAVGAPAVTTDVKDRSGRGGGYFPTTPTDAQVNNNLNRPYGRGGQIVRDNFNAAAMAGQPGYMRITTMRGR